MCGGRVDEGVAPPHPSQTRMCSFPASGSSWESLARGGSRKEGCHVERTVGGNPLPRSTTPAEPTTPRLLTVSSMLPPRFPRRRLQRLMNFGVLSRGFGTCCLRFKNGVATTHAKLASGWLARLYREGVEPSGSLQKVSDHPPSFSGLSLAQGKFHFAPPFRFTLLDHLVGAQEQRGGQLNADRLRGLEIDDQLVFDRLLDR